MEEVRCQVPGGRCGNLQDYLIAFHISLNNNSAVLNKRGFLLHLSTFEAVNTRGSFTFYIIRNLLTRENSSFLNISTRILNIFQYIMNFRPSMYSITNAHMKRSIWKKIKLLLLFPLQAMETKLKTYRDHAPIVHPRQ